MPKWRILLTDGLQNAGVEILQQHAEIVDRSGINAEDLMGVIKNVDAVIVRSRTKMTRDIIQASDRLKVIGRCGVGVDNIDLQAAEKANVTVVNAPSATTTSVAELTLGLIFSLAREIPRADKSMKDGNWMKKEFRGTELAGRTLGVIGFGSIGSKVGELAANLGMRILAKCHIDIPCTIEELGAEAVSMDQLLQESDFITIHTPLNKTTRGLIGEKSFEKMKNGVFLICTARGGIIDENALLDALESGKVAGAALDVFEHEPPENLDLVRHPKVIATPHIAGQTLAAQRRAAEDISKEVLAALEGEELRWKIV